MNAFKDNILRKIRSGEVDMKPKWHFVLRTGLYLSGVVVVTLVAIYLLSFIFFALHRNGLWFAPMFGVKGIILFFFASPWILILALTLFLTLLYILVREYAFSYRKPLVYSMVGIALFVLGASTVTHFTVMHDRLDSFSREHRVPGFAPLYERTEKNRPEGMYIGTITEISEGKVTLRTPDNETVTILINANTKMRAPSVLTLHNDVVVFSEERDGVVHAFGIREMEDIPPPPRGDRGIGNGMR